MKKQWLLLALLSGRKLPLQPCSEARQCSSYLYIPDAFQTPIPVLELKVNESVSEEIQVPAPKGNLGC